MNGAACSNRLSTNLQSLGQTCRYGHAMHRIHKSSQSFYAYRLAPEYKFPAALEDTNLVVQWMLEHAQDYALDTEHVFMVGDSAGAHLLGLYTGICTNPEYAGKYSFTIPQVPCVSESLQKSDDSQNIRETRDAERGNRRRFPEAAGRASVQQAFGVPDSVCISVLWRQGT